MPATTRARGKPSADTIYRSTPAAPQQQEFPGRRRTVKKTYGRSRPKREPNQETLTQMNFTSSAMRDFLGLDDDGDDGRDEKEDNEEEEEKEEEEVEDDEREELTVVESKTPRPTQEPKAKAKSRNNRRRTAGEDLNAEEKPRQSKRRKTLGDLPNPPSTASSFHTQTLTQMLSFSDKEEDPWQIEDSQDDEENDLVVKTPKTASRRHGKSEAQENIESAVPSLVESATPVNRQKKTEIPSSQSPLTPMLLRYGAAPGPSPLKARSTKVDAPSPILKTSRPRNAVIPDSYSTAHESSPIDTPQKSTANATPSKRLRFNIPEDKENITPGRTKPKSPKPKSQPTGRTPLQEVPDSDEDLDEDLDETEYETEEDEFGGQDPESPTPKRFRIATPAVENTEPELETSQTVVRHLGVLEENGRLASHELGVDPPSEITLVPTGESSVGSSDPRLEARGSQSKHSKSISESHAFNGDIDLEAGTEIEIQSLETPRAKRKGIEADPAPAVARVSETAALELDVDEDEDIRDELSPSQNYMFTQGAESQRLPLDSIRALGPQTPHSDIMVSLHPEHIARIVDRTKNHEFRTWRIPQEVYRIWVYITRPNSELKYMCRFGEPKTPGEVQDDKGIGNVEFNQGKTPSKFAYEILQVYELNNPVSLDEMKRKGWVSGAPQKYTYIPPAVVGELTANLRCALFDDGPQSQRLPNQDASESQELKAQLQSDADYSTQHYSEGNNDEIIPASQSPRKNSGDSSGTVGRDDSARPALARVRSIQSNLGSPLPPQQRSAVRSSQATTVSQVSSSPAITSPTRRSGRHNTINLTSSSPTRGLRHTHSSLRSSQFPTVSQMLPESLLNDDIHEPPPIVWDSADEHSD
ncbi:hypothetical protein F4808DRAFT_413994 [Astrocystis sublimbata]|nr:hypothetical protein F4808DRAFT_413994 [Astrocystis sublimbata]